MRETKKGENTGSKGRGFGDGGGGGGEGDRSHKTDGLESIIRQQFFLSNHFPKRKEV